MMVRNTHDFNNHTAAGSITRPRVVIAVFHT